MCSQILASGLELLCSAICSHVKAGGNVGDRNADIQGLKPKLGWLRRDHQGPASELQIKEQSENLIIIRAEMGIFQANG